MTNWTHSASGVPKQNRMQWIPKMMYLDASYLEPFCNYIIQKLGERGQHPHQIESLMLQSAKKDGVPTTQKSCVVYEFLCRCEARYVVRTTQRLADRIKQYCNK